MSSAACAGSSKLKIRRPPRGPAEARRDATDLPSHAPTQDKTTFLSAVAALVEFIRRVREDGTRDERPHFLHLDGHFSHFSPEALQLLLDNNIHVFFIPSHSSQRLQSADCGLQACFKAVLKVSQSACAVATHTDTRTRRVCTVSALLGTALRPP